MAISTSGTGPEVKTARGIVRWAGQMITALVIFGTLLFVAAGRLNWIAGWVYLGMNMITQTLSAILLIPRQGEMLAERSQVRHGTKDWDGFLAPAIVIVGTLAVLITAGLDARFGWSAPFEPGLSVLGLVIAFGSQMFVLWAMASNPYFALTVRIQNERGQSVSKTGPYELVRHPGYAGSLIYNLAIPFVLGSWWTFIPVLFTIMLTIIRTWLEDQTLRRELPGYEGYTQDVKYRLLPHIW